MPEKQRKFTTVTDHNLQEMRQHGTTEFPVGVYTDDFAEFEQGMIPWHWHEEIQFDLVLEGRIHFQTGSRVTILTSGQAVFINAGVLHQILPEEGTEGKIAAYVLRDSLLESDVLSEVYQKCILPVIKGQTDCVVFEEEGGREAKYLREIKELFENAEAGCQIEIKGLFCCLWGCLLKKAQREIGTVSLRERRDMDRIKTAIMYIQSRFNEPLSLEAMAGCLAVSKSELCRCFQRVMGITPYEYLIRHRIGEASKLLRQTDERILDIALACGFDSIGHMGRYFRRYCGCSPSAFRKKI